MLPVHATIRPRDDSTREQSKQTHRSTPERSRVVPPEAARARQSVLAANLKACTRARSAAAWPWLGGRLPSLPDACRPTPGRVGHGCGALEYLHHVQVDVQPHVLNALHCILLHVSTHLSLWHSHARGRVAQWQALSAMCFRLDGEEASAICCCGCVLGAGYLCAGVPTPLKMPLRQSASQRSSLPSSDQAGRRSRYGP